MKLPQSKVSRHLAYLRRAGLVRYRKDGLWKHYSLTAPHRNFHRVLVGCLQSCFDEVDILKRDLAALKRGMKKKSC